MKKMPARPQWPRKIIHLDMDAFFAAIEQRDFPQYRGKPVVVGGDPQSRGVVSTCSYEARKFGIHSAMAAAQAFRLCPQAIFLRPRFEVYQKVSRQVMEILHRHTDLVEAASLDEAYLDVTVHKLKAEDPVMIATLIKQHIHAATGLTASAGVATNMFLAKVASDFKKPDGLTVILPGEEAAFLEKLPVRKIPGVGPVTEKRLLGLGYETCGDLAAADTRDLEAQLGKWGRALSRRALGIDDRQVEPGGDPKQCSVEETFEKDTRDVSFLRERLEAYAEEVFADLKRKGLLGRTVVLKLKYFDFKSITRSLTLERPPSGPREIYEVAERLLRTKTLAGRKPVRLLGVGIGGLRPEQEFAGTFTPDLFSFMESGT